eukprot:7280449-Alexandrium_andersonii.AAC.1
MEESRGAVGPPRGKAGSCSKPRETAQSGIRPPLCIYRFAISAAQGSLGAGGDLSLNGRRCGG